jgi:hypothetical protein
VAQFENWHPSPAKQFAEKLKFGTSGAKESA